ncbi:Antitoxin to RelE-like translational repressor toxin [hydrothermal vent metagenome]|uniref:Antitoxin to RelE-like translational repressor toxin n=1 Tax=hydrothermal vent metagenome TaxID=652676 RepID=A0A3B1ACY5_9ZZZZ
MDEKLFNQLVDSVQEAGATYRASKQTLHHKKLDAPDVKTIRGKIGLSQSRFAFVMGVSVRTLQNWEQGHRTPQGPAVSLLRIVDHDPVAALKAIYN